MIPTLDTPTLMGAGLDQFDLIVVHTSGGKDSQTVLRQTAQACRAAGVLDRLVALHINLGPRVEWPQVPELAEEQARRNGVPFHMTRRPGGDLLDDIATRRKRDGTVRGWPTLWTRYCTSDHKTAPGRKYTESLCQAIRAEHGLDRPVRVLQVMGFRAEESRARAQRPVFSLNERVSAMRSRLVWEWLPIHEWTEDQVWADIHASGIPHHPVYDLGMSRLSCCFCIAAAKGDLAIAKRLAPETARQYEAVEDALGDAFQYHRPLASVAPQAGPTGLNVVWKACQVCNVPVLAVRRSRDVRCPRHREFGCRQGLELSEMRHMRLKDRIPT